MMIVERLKQIFQPCPPGLWSWCELWGYTEGPRLAPCAPGQGHLAGDSSSRLPGGAGVEQDEAEDAAALN